MLRLASGEDVVCMVLDNVVGDAGRGRRVPCDRASLPTRHLNDKKKADHWRKA
jgi:hypothetical protein